ncbi:MAG: phosphatase PAP2 family protein [Actinomycetota bacterium]
MPPVIQRADERAFTWLAAKDIPALDATLPRLSKAANHSLLWIAIAAVFASFGGRKGRTAAARGLAAIALSSIVVNGPVKIFANRHRPKFDAIPLSRRLARVPVSSSFPSGHTASAVAFATAVGMEFPRTAAPLGILAAGVGVSRAYTGVHYPSDVAVGAAIGAGAAVLTRRFVVSRGAHAPAAASLPARRTIDVGRGSGLVVMVNPSAGPHLARDPAEAIREAFPDACIVETDEDPAGAVRSKCDRHLVAIVAAGGDGSINAAAAVAQELGVPLGVIPAGTLNHLARDLGIEDIGSGIETIRGGRLVQIDIGSIADSVFLNTASFGAYAELVDERESLESKIGKWPAAFVALWRTMGNDPIRVEIDGRAMRIWGIFIGNGCYTRGFVPMRRLSLDDGRLDVRILRADRRYPRLRALILAGPHRLARLSAFESRTAARIEVRSLDGPLRLARDGETFDGPARFTVEKFAKPLEVFVP